MQFQSQIKDFLLHTILLETVELYARTMDLTDGPTTGKRFWMIPFRSLFSRLAVLIAREPCVWPDISKETPTTQLLNFETELILIITTRHRKPLYSFYARVQPEITQCKLCVP